MDFDKIFDGTPAEFGVVMNSSGHLFQKYVDNQIPFIDQIPFLMVDLPTLNPGQPIPPDINPLRVWFVFQGMPQCDRCYITATSLPNNKSNLHVAALEENWSRLSIIWYVLYNEMKRQGWIDNDQNNVIPIVEKETREELQPKGSKKPLGRKSDHSLAERDEVVKERLDLEDGDDKNIEPLEIYLLHKYGEKNDSSFPTRLNIPKSTYYYWKTDFLKRHSKRSMDHKKKHLERSGIRKKKTSKHSGVQQKDDIYRNL
jgi:hypothetical protein